MRKSKINKMPSDDIFYGEKYRIQSEEYGDCYIYIYKVVRDVLPHKLIFEDRCKCAIQEPVMWMKELFHQQEV